MLYSELYALTFWIARVFGFIEGALEGYGLESPSCEASKRQTLRHAGAQKDGVTSASKGRLARTLVGLV